MKKFTRTLEKICIGIVSILVFSLSFIATPVLAAQHFDVVNDGTLAFLQYATNSCTVGDTIVIFFHDLAGNPVAVGSQPCGITLRNDNPQGDIAGQYITFVECDSTVPLSDCTGDLTLANQLIDSGYVSTYSLHISQDNRLVSPALQWLLEIFLIFLISSLVFTFIIYITKRLI